MFGKRASGLARDHLKRSLCRTGSNKSRDGDHVVAELTEGAGRGVPKRVPGIKASHGKQPPVGARTRQKKGEENGRRSFQFAELSYRMMSRPKGVRRQPDSKEGQELTDLEGGGLRAMSPAVKQS